METKFCRPPLEEQVTKGEMYRRLMELRRYIEENGRNHQYHCPASRSSDWSSVYALDEQGVNVFDASMAESEEKDMGEWYKEGSPCQRCQQIMGYQGWRKCVPDRLL